MTTAYLRLAGVRRVAGRGECVTLAQAITPTGSDFASLQMTEWRVGFGESRFSESGRRCVHPPPHITAQEGRPRSTERHVGDADGGPRVYRRAGVGCTQRRECPERDKCLLRVWAWEGPGGGAEFECGKKGETGCVLGCVI